ncbi:MAG TPA: SWIM zinc finger family protein, partial [Trebonia sp.]|nr:SWIM zinc finger family protein [Trebonia sp.]
MVGAINPAGAARWPAERIQALAPDPASLKAGVKLSSPGPWSEYGARSEAGLVWGACRGSGAKPYQVSAQFPDGAEGQPVYKCTCPSRKFPCKHILGLLLLWSAGAVPETGPDAIPARVHEWLDSRRERAERGE